MFVNLLWVLVKQLRKGEAGGGVTLIHRNRLKFVNAFDTLIYVHIFSECTKWSRRNILLMVYCIFAMHNLYNIFYLTRERKKCFKFLRLAKKSRFIRQKYIPLLLKKLSNEWLIMYILSLSHHVRVELTFKCIWPSCNRCS